MVCSPPGRSSWNPSRPVVSVQCTFQAPKTIRGFSEKFPAQFLENHKRYMTGW